MAKQKTWVCDCCDQPTEPLDVRAEYPEGWVKVVIKDIDASYGRLKWCDVIAICDSCAPRLLTFAASLRHDKQPINQ